MYLKRRMFLSAALGLFCVAPNYATVTPAQAETITGTQVMAAYHDKAANKACTAGPVSRWMAHYSNAPRQLADPSDPTLSLFNYVLEEMHDAGLASEYAMIPFVESSYFPHMQSRLGPTGLWQMVRGTAVNFKVPMKNGYDGRLSPVDSTRSVITYLKYLNKMFKGDEERVVMAYNAGEGRMKNFLRGQTKLSEITHAYPKKINALSCLIDKSMDKPAFKASMNRKVPKLRVVRAESGASNLAAWSKEKGYDPVWIRKLNPALASGSIAGREVLVHDPK